MGYSRGWAAEWQRWVLDMRQWDTFAFFQKREADIVKRLKPDIQARPSPYTGSKGFVCPSKRNFIICEGEQSAKGLDSSTYNHPRLLHNGPEYIFDWLCMRGAVPSVVPDM